MERRGGREGGGREGEGKNDLTHRLSQIPGYATGFQRPQTGNSTVADTASSTLVPVCV